MHDRDSSSFKTNFKLQVIGLSFEVNNSFLPQLASKLQAAASGGPEKVPGKDAFYYINHHNSGTFTDSTARKGLIMFLDPQMSIGMAAILSCTIMS